MDKINVLLLGKEDWNEKYKLPEHIDLTFVDSFEEPVGVIFDIVILDRDISYDEKNILQKCARAYGLFVTENAKLVSYTKSLYDSKMGNRLFSGDAMTFFENEAPKYYTNSYGEKMQPKHIAVNQLFKGKVVFNGNYDLKLTGDFGENYSQIVYWKHNFPLGKDQCLDMYLEYSKTENVSIKMRIIQFYGGSISDIEQIWEYDEEQLKDIIKLENKMEQGNVSISILAKGEGELHIHSLHDRFSRKDIGYFIPGGERFVAPTGEEIFAYFDPGDMKPPLSVYFSGYKTQEGFEGYYMMKSMKCPVLLITEARLEGGGFYVGDDSYEEMITHVIRGYLSKLGFSNKELILSGASMGTMGAMYHGCSLSPHALILGKPLANFGNIAKYERIDRPGGFPTSLDLLLKNFGSLSEDAISSFNNKFWDRFDNADWNNTKFVISYLYEDDYDPDAYRDILTHIHGDNVQVYGKGIHGRHTDNTAAVFSWFKSQYKKLLSEDFGRKM